MSDLTRRQRQARSRVAVHTRWTRYYLRRAAEHDAQAEQARAILEAES